MSQLARRIEDEFTMIIFSHGTTGRKKRKKYSAFFEYKLAWEVLEKYYSKKYTWEKGHEQEFKETWNDVCATRYKDLLYKCRRKGIRPSFIPEDIWNAWRAIWAVEKWQSNAVTARANRNTELADPSTGSLKHTAGSRSIVEHTLDLEHELQRSPTCWEIFSKTHKSKDDTYVDKRSEAFEAELNARLSRRLSLLLREVRDKISQPTK